MKKFKNIFLIINIHVQFPEKKRDKRARIHMEGMDVRRGRGQLEVGTWWSVGSVFFQCLTTLYPTTPPCSLTHSLYHLLYGPQHGLSFFSFFEYQKPLII